MEKRNVYTQKNTGNFSVHKPFNTSNSQKYSQSDKKNMPNEQQATENIQRYLRQLSFFDSDIPSLAIDGIFEQATRDSLTAFQRKYGLPPSGVADRLTFDTLYQEYLASLEKNALPLPMDIFPFLPVGYEIGIGERGFSVYAIRYMLNEINTRNYGQEPIDVAISDIYDQTTMDNIKKFQERNGLYQSNGSVSGKTDIATWNKLILLYSKLFGEGFE
jgi:peptidoglycan hydrolase-like protein with peptidoglycan-binding domain